MGKCATVTTATVSRVYLGFTTAFIFACISVGCRAPWVSTNSDRANLDSLQVSELNRPSSRVQRVRPENQANSAANTRSAASKPTAQLAKTESASLDEVEDQELQDALAATPPQDLDRLRMTYEALSKRKMDSTPRTYGRANETQARMADNNSDATFSMSDDDPAAEQSIVADTQTHRPAPTTTPTSTKSKPRLDSVASSSLNDDQSSRQSTSPSTKPVSSPAQQSAKSAQTVVVSPEVESPAVVSASAEAPAANVDAVKVAHISDALTTATKADWRKLVHEAIAAAEAENSAAAMGESPEQKLHREASIRMLSLVAGDLDSALEPIAALQSGEKDYSHAQEYFRNQLQAFNEAIDPQGNPVLGRRWTLAMQSQRKAHAHLAAVSNLEVQNVAFCTEVDSYGIITKFPQYHFRPDQELLLYCELDNFVAEPVKDGFQTQLQGSYEIVDANGRRVADQLLPMDEHVCRNQRRDYFIAYRVYMPQDIKPGSYHLKLTIEDMKGRKFGQSNVDFQVMK